MKSTIRVGILLAFIVIIFTIFSGCTTTSGPTQPISNQASSTPGSSTQTNVDFSMVTHVNVSTIAGHDGITVHLNLLDQKNQTVIWSGVKLPVDIDIWSTRFDSNRQQIKDSLVFRKIGASSEWREGNAFMGGEIQIPSSEMRVPTGATNGWTYVTVHIPDGKTFSVTDEYTPLNPS